MFHWTVHFGIPFDVTCHRALQFTSGFWAAITKLLGVLLHHMTVYHPLANSYVVCSLLYKHNVKAQTGWMNYLGFY